MTEQLKSHPNFLLTQLCQEDLDQLLASGSLVQLDRGKDLGRDGEDIRDVYFPISLVASYVVGTEAGQVVETATVGNEGMIGADAILDVRHHTMTAMVQIKGYAVKVPSSVFVQMRCESGRFDQVMGRYIAFLLRSAHQTAACNALHHLEQRACRWLLTTHDRVGGDEFELTQELLAEMLGVRRQSVTQVAGALQERGLIRYRRGRIQIQERRALEGASCECYEASRGFFHRLVQKRS